MAVSVIGFSVTGCNSITGADGIEVQSGDGGGGAGGGDGATTTTTVECTYPTTGFSPKPGGVMPNHTWKGFVNESTEPSDVSLADYLDCDGSKGINALLIDVSATWCGSCQEEAQTLTNKMKSKWEALGIRVLTLMIEDADHMGASVDTALQWKQAFHLTSTTVAADPQLFFAPVMQEVGSGLPFLLVIDPRTMTLVQSTQNTTNDEAALEDLAKKNQTP